MTKDEAIKLLLESKDNDIQMSLREWEEWDKRYFEAIDMVIEALSVERTGYWIEGQTAGQKFVKCSCCGHIEFDSTPNYCEDCGVRMVEGEEK